MNDKEIIEAMIRLLTKRVKEPEIKKEKKNRCYFVNSRGEVSHTDHYLSEKHQKRVAFGNAFASKEEAEKAVEEIRDTLFCVLNYT